jgi:regulator of replication initiation timing
MVREGYWDFMGRKLREEGPKTTKIDMEGLLKRDITEMQKTVHFLQTRVRDLTELEGENMLLRIEIQQLQGQLQNSYKRIAELSATVFKKRIAELRNSKPKQLEFNL